MKRKIQVLGWTLIWSGVFIFGYVGWQLYGTDLINARVQDQASEDLDLAFAAERNETPDTTEVVPEDGSPDSDPIRYFVAGEPDPGEGFALLSVPRLGLEAVVFEGVDRETLTKGPGHMPGTPLPGQSGNAVISGHRTTYGRPFHDFDLLEPGDLIEVETSVGTHVYEVRQSQIVQPDDVWVTENREGGWLTFTTCNPKYSARERLIVFAEMVSGPNYDYIDYLSRI